MSKKKISKKKDVSKPNENKKLPLSREAVFTGVLAVLFFLLICLSAPDAAKGTGLVMMFLASAVLLIRHKVLRERMGYISLALILITVMGGISTFYAGSGKYALAAFLGLAIALSTALVLLALPGKNVATAHRIAIILSGCAALAGLVSIDLIATRWLSTQLVNFLSNFSEMFYSLHGVESGVRITSILGNANIFASVMGIGVLLSLSLALNCDKRAERVFHLSCLYISSTAFVLAFSMGALGAIVCAFGVFLLLEHPERRGGLFVLMAETLVCVMLSVGIISAVALETWDGVQVIPLLCLVLGAAVLSLADRYIGIRLTSLLRGHGRLLFGIIIALLVCTGIFAAAACCWTSGITLEPDEGLRRSVYPQPGTYTISAEGANTVSVTVTAQDRQNAMTHTNEVLYEGSLSAASFTVPEDAIVVWLNFSADSTVSLKSVQLMGRETISVPLDYILLPDFIANRIQGFFANQNVIQRFVFFSDGLKLFRRSPIIGLGLGAFENSLFSVQSFDYETKYVHNHYIQTLLETGIIGLSLFLGLFGISAAAIFRARRRTEFSPLLPALGGIYGDPCRCGSCLLIRILSPYGLWCSCAYRYLLRQRNPSAKTWQEISNRCADCYCSIPAGFCRVGGAESFRGKVYEKVTDLCFL